MTNKSRDMLKIIVGAYLVWMGIDLFRSALTNRPEKYVMFLLFGAAFVIIGGLIAFTSAKRRLNPDSYPEEVADEEEADEEEADGIEEAVYADDTVDTENTAHITENTVTEDITDSGQTEADVKEDM